jgi:CheY-like chemotaxis protein
MAEGGEAAVTVLMIDDEAEFLESTARALGRRGFEVLTASSGEVGLRTLAELPVHIVVLDLKMPGMDGEEVLRRLRVDHPRLPVIMLTGHGSISHAFRMASRGVVEYLAKPIDVDQLADLIGEHALTERPAQGQGRTVVLLVDDEAELVDSLSKVLSKRGMEVLAAGDGAQALEVMGKADVDVVVLDVRMPVMDGLETLREIRSGWPDCGVILLTGDIRAQDALRSLRLGGKPRELGVMEYLTKPPDIPRLIELIRLAAASRRQGLGRGEA